MKSVQLKTIVHVRRGARTIAHQTPKFVKRVTYSVIPVTIYNVGTGEHHTMTLDDFQKTIFDTTMVEIIHTGCKMLLHIK